MSAEIPRPRLSESFTPMHDNLAAEFAQHELTDARLEHWLEVFGA